MRQQLQLLPLLLLLLLLWWLVVALVSPHCFRGMCISTKHDLVVVVDRNLKILIFKNSLYYN